MPIKAVPPSPPPPSPPKQQHRIATTLLVAVIGGVVAVVLIVVLIAVALSGASHTTKIGKAVQSTNGVQPTTTLEPTTLPSTTSTTVSSPLTATFNTLYPITNSDGTAALLKVAPPVFDASFLDGIEKPTYGQFVSFLVTFTGGVKGWSYNEFDFYVRGPDGAHCNPSSAKQPTLSSGTLHADEPVTGYVTFDAPAHGTLVYAPNFGRASLAEWSY